MSVGLWQFIADIAFLVFDVGVAALLVAALARLEVNNDELRGLRRQVRDLRSSEPMAPAMQTRTRPGASLPPEPPT